MKIPFVPFLAFFRLCRLYKKPRSCALAAPLPVITKEAMNLEHRDLFSCPAGQGQALRFTQDDGLRICPGKSLHEITGGIIQPFAPGIFGLGARVQVFLF